MYHVIVVSDETKNKSYYYSYVSEKGNITCDTLPPFQDLQKAQACYWDEKALDWVYDAEKYAEIVEEQKRIQTAAEQERLKEEAVPDNAELAAAVLEIADSVSTLIDAVTELAEGITMKGGE